MRARGGRGFRRRRKIAFLVGFGAPVMPGGSISMRGDQNWKQNSKSRSCSWERARWSFLKVCLVYASQRKTHPQNLEIYVKKRRLHAVPSCGSDRLKRHFREGSVAGISHIRKAWAPREPWKIRKKRIFFSLFEIYKVWKNVKIHVIVESWGHMLFLIWEMSATDPSGEP